MNPEFSVIVPVFNSETTLNELFQRVKTTFERLDKTFELVFVDDGSTDNSWHVLKELKQQFPDQITAVKLTQNYGQHNAVFCGIHQASGSLFVTIDDDLQIPPEEIEKLIDTFEKHDADLVYGTFKKKKHSWFRNLSSKILKAFSKALTNKPVERSSFRLFTSALAKQILNHHQAFIYLDELFPWYTGNIASVTVEHHKRTQSRSGYSFGKLFSLVFNLVFFHTTLPLKLMTITGFLLSIVSFLLGVRFIIAKLARNVPLGYTSMIVVILFSTSIILLCLGILGEYFARLYLMQNKKPPYSIKTILK